MKSRLRPVFTPLFLLGLVLFVLPWFWVLKVPATRNLFVKQVTGNTGFPPAAPWSASLSYPYGSRSVLGMPNHDFSSLAANYPNDPQVQAKVAESATASAPTTGGTGLPKEAQMRAYRGLIVRFPRESWLHAHYLRDAVSSFKDHRMGGAFSSSPPLSPYGNAPEGTGQSPNFTPQQLDEALKIARQGQALEPDNAFFGLYEGILLWMGHRDEEAWGALHRASLLPRYEDHTCDDKDATLKVWQLQRGPLVWEEQIATTALLPIAPTSQFREKARQWSWAAWKLERAGRHREAITRRADLARLFDKTLHGRSDQISGLVGVAIQAIMWSGNPNRRVNVRAMTAQQRANVGNTVRLAAKSFADYARAHGESAIADETVRLGEASARFRTLSRASISGSTSGNMPHTLIYQNRALWWAACGLLGSGVLVLGAWLTTSALLVRAGGECARGRFVLPVVGFCVALTALIYGKFNGAATEEFFIYPTPSLSKEAVGFIGILQVAALLLPVALPALLCGIPSWLRLWRVRRTNQRTAESEHLPRDMRPLVWTFLTACSLLVAVGGWLFAAAFWIAPSSVLLFATMGSTIQDAEGLTVLATIFAAMASVLWLMGWLLRWRFFVPLAERPLTHSALRRFQTTLGVLLVIGSWAYALTLSATLAPRREADRLFALEQRQGAIGAMEAAANAQTVNSTTTKPPRSTP